MMSDVATVRIPSFWDEAKMHLTANDAVMGKIIASYAGENLSSRGDAFGTLARSVTGQQISVKAADSLWKKLETQLVDVAPQHILGLSDEAFRLCGYSRPKILYLRNIAHYFLENEAEILTWSDAQDAHVIKELCTVKGIGRWTAEMFLIFYLLKPNVLPLDDIGLQKGIEKHYADGQKLTKSEYLAIAKPWEPYASVATWYLWRSLDPVPVEY